ncbi:MAG: ABC-ATPase UvrA, partial [Bdellovibrionaceae bacterium]|nr:ABC-ATPase UvrA [Pseudobdellovibrionaceae bacterium]
VSQTPQQIVDDIFKKSMGTKFLILAPMAQAKKGEFLAEFQKWAKKGFVKAKVDGTYVELEKASRLAKTKTHDIDLVIDQLILKDNIKHRLSESINTALSMAQGRLVIETLSGERVNYSLHSTCPVCAYSFPELEPRLFSFNNPRGACTTCNGLGTLDLVEEEQFSDSDVGGRKLENVKYSFKGKKVSDDAGDDDEAEELILSTCPDCKGSRLKTEALSIKIEEKNIAQLSDLSIVELREFLQKTKWTDKNKMISEKILKQIISRLEFLERVGTSYLSISRPARTLSGGEAQRIRLATQVGSALIGCMYVMDEPSIGLHPRDHHRLLEIIGELKDRGNTIILVEHDEDTIRYADYVVDLGPRAGRLGGELLAVGTPEEIEKNLNSLTGQYLSGQRRIQVPKVRRPGTGKKLKLFGATGNNLQNVDLEIPLGTLTCVTGVSGSGKSTLVLDTLYKILAQTFFRAHVTPSPYKKIEG